MRKVKRALAGIIALFLVLALGTYGKWEMLTYHHEQEFREVIERDLQENMWSPTAGFLRVIEYGAESAKVYTKSGRIQYMIYYQRDMDNQWDRVCSNYCLASNGSNRCFFPWYSPSSFWDQVAYYSHGRGCESKGY